MPSYRMGAVESCTQGRACCRVRPNPASTMTTRMTPSADEIDRQYDRMKADPTFAALMIEIASMIKPPALGCTIDEAESEVRSMTDSIGHACLEAWCQSTSDRRTGQILAAGSTRTHEKKSS